MKKFLIALLSLAVLFSFAACDNNQTTSGEGAIATITARQNEVYVEGEIADPADFTFTGYTVNNTPVSIDSADVTFVNPSALAAGNGNNYSVIYNGVVFNNAIAVTAEDVTGISVNTDDSKAVYYAVLDSSTYAGTGIPTARTVDKTGIVVTAKYNDGEKVVDNSVVSFTNSTWTKGKQTVTVTFATQTASYEINVLENTVESVSLEKTADYTVYKTSTVSDTTGDAFKIQYADATTGVLDDDASGIYMQAKYIGGEVVVVPETLVKYLDTSANTYTIAAATNITFPKTANDTSFTVTASYNGADTPMEFEREGYPQTIALADDSIVGVEWTLPTEIADGNYNSTTAPTGLSVTVKTASGSAYYKSSAAVTVNYNGAADEGDTDYFVIEPLEIPATQVGNLVEITASAYINGAEEPYTTSFTARVE